MRIKTLIVAISLLLMALTTSAQRTGIPNFSLKYDVYWQATYKFNSLSNSTARELYKDTVRVGTPGTFLALKIFDSKLWIQGYLDTTRIVEYNYQVLKNKEGAVTNTIYFFRLQNDVECTFEDINDFLQMNYPVKYRQWKTVTFRIIKQQQPVSD